MRKKNIMTLKITLMCACYVVLDIASAASVYDQSQTGKLNVQIDLKDLQVIALTKSTKEEYVDYDYAYDYSEMTIKPQNGTTVTSKPLNVTSSTDADVSLDNATIATTVAAETTTELIKNVTGKPEVVASTTQNAISTTTTTKSVKYKNTKYTTKKWETIVTTAPVFTNNTNCTRGHVVCEALLQNKPLSILELLSQRFKRRDHRKDSVDKE